MNLLVELLKLKEAFVPMDDDDDVQDGMRVKISKHYGGGMGRVTDTSPSRKFLVVKTDKGETKYFHRSDLLIRK